MAEYVEEYGTSLHRAETISTVDGKLRVLDFTLGTVRAAALSAVDADELYRAHSADYQ